MARAAVGDFRLLVTIEHLVSDDTGSGFPVETFERLGDVRMAQAVVTAEREGLTADQVTARTYHEWRMPYLAAMDPDAVDVLKARRLVYRGRIYDVVQAWIDRVTPVQIALITLVKAE